MLLAALEVLAAPVVAVAAFGIDKDYGGSESKILAPEILNA